MLKNGTVRYFRFFLFSMHTQINSSHALNYTRSYKLAVIDVYDLFEFF